MKKQLLLTLGIFAGVQALKCQTVVFNDKLLAQITKNQTVRLASNKSLLNSYEKQREMYDKINEKIAQVVAIQGFIYNNLYNINSALLQGKQLHFIYLKFEEMAQNATIVLNYTVTKPQYAILLYNYYDTIVKELLRLKKQLTEEILKEGNDFLMDAADRSALIDIIRVRANIINGNLLYIKWLLEASKETPYIYQIPYIRNYINLDKVLVNDIIQRWKWIF
ncbi:MAG: hypothetical protein QM564_12015 [Bergeyella sp.]